MAWNNFICVCYNVHNYVMRNCDVYLNPDLITRFENIFPDIISATSSGIILGSEECFFKE